MDNVKRIMEKKTGKGYETTYETSIPELVYESLAKDLISKKICACTWIKSIKRIQNYNGTITIIVNYNNNTRSVYTIND